ncbi:MAG: hypothetical protein Q9222_005264 [Ikaeria aurantiellina]
MHTSTDEGRAHDLPIRPCAQQSPPPPPSPSADVSIIPQIGTPPDESQDPTDDLESHDIDIFRLSTTVALKMLCTTAEVLIKFASDHPPMRPLPVANPPKPRLLAAGKENQRPHSRSSSLDRRKAQQAAMPEGWDNADSVPEKAKTPIGSPESKPSEPSQEAGVDSEPLDRQDSWVSKKFNSKKPPPIPLEEYLLRLHKFCPTSTGVYLAAGLYIYQIVVHHRSICVTPRNVHRLFLAALRVAGKANHDYNYHHNRFAIVGGVTAPELARLEVNLCYLADFELRATAEMLQKYAHIAKDRTRMYEKLEESMSRTLSPLKNGKTSPAAAQVYEEIPTLDIEASAAA